MNLPRAAIKRPVTTFMLMLMMILLGGISLVNTRLDLLPKIDLPMIAVMVSAPGTAPEEVVELATIPVEAAVSTVRGVANVNSFSQEHMSLTLVEFNWGTDLEAARADISQNLERLKLAEGIQEPILVRFDPTMLPMMQLSVTSAQMPVTELFEYLRREVVPRLEEIDGVASVSVTGAAAREVQVLLDQDLLQEHDLTLSQVASTIQAGHLNLPAGTVYDADRELSLRLVGKLPDVAALENLPVTMTMDMSHLPSPGGLPSTPGGLAGLSGMSLPSNMSLPTSALPLQVVRVKDIASVKVQAPDARTITRTNGQPGLQVAIQKEGDANTVMVARAVGKKLTEMQETFPELTFNSIMNQGEFIEEAILNVARKLLVGALLAVFILLIFLRDIPSTMIIGLTIPFSIIVTFVLVYFRGLTINVMSLGGLALGVGMLVDNSIVVLENIHRRLTELGEDPVEAAEKGTNQVLLAITASTLTTLAVFLPVVFIGGITGEIFRELALTVTFSLLASLLVAVTVIPVMAAHFMGQRKRKPGAVRTTYVSVLEKALAYPGVTLGIAGALFALSLLFIPAIGTEFMPAADERAFSIGMDLPPGTSVEVLDRHLQTISDIVAENAATELIYTSAGRGEGLAGYARVLVGSATPGHVRVLLGKDSEEKAADIVERLRPLIADALPNLDVTFTLESEMAAISGEQARSIQFNVSGPDTEGIKQATAEVKAVLADIDGLHDIQDNLQKLIPERQVLVDREKALRRGLLPALIGTTLSDAQQGRVVSRLRVDDQDMDIRVILRPEQRDNPDNLKELLLKGVTGETVALKEVASIESGHGPLTITRVNRRPTAQITAVFVGRDLGSVTSEALQAVDDLDLPAGYTVKAVGAAQLMRESLDKLTFALVLAIVLIYMIMASQFESLLHPFIILLSLPLATIGVLFGLLISGYSLGVTAMIGIIVLAGVVVNNAIVMVDFINQGVREGMPLHEALLEAGRTRLRPILMTALTTILGLIPLALGIGEGAEIMAPMAVTMIGGLITSTLLTLLVVPVIYKVLLQSRLKPVDS